MSWSRDQVAILINEYRKHPCLYAVKTKQYMNKHARSLAFKSIISVIDPYKPGVTMNDIKSKFSGLRATFLNDHKKYKNSVRSGSGEDEVYKPSLWYYDDLYFLLDHTESRSSIDSISWQESESATLNEDTQDSQGPNTEQMEASDTQHFIVDDNDGLLKEVNATVDQHDQPESSSSNSPNESSRPQLQSASTIYQVVKTPKNKKKRPVNQDDIYLRDASTVLSKISSHVDKVSANTETQVDSNNSNTALAQFVISKLNQITSEDVRLDIEEQIVGLLYSGIKRSKEATE